MALSDYELRILREIEVDLRRPAHPLLARARDVAGDHWLAALIVAGALAVIVLAALFAPAAAAAPLGGIAGAAAGYAACLSRCRASRRNH